MNTKHFILAVAAVAFAACTQIEKPIEEIEDIIPETPTYSDTPIALTYSTVDAVETKAAQNLKTPGRTMPSLPVLQEQWLPLIPRLIILPVLRILTL